jgi:hypothetical protein
MYEEEVLPLKEILQEAYDVLDKLEDKLEDGLIDENLLNKIHYCLYNEPRWTYKIK